MAAAPDQGRWPVDLRNAILQIRKIVIAALRLAVIGNQACRTAGLLASKRAKPSTICTDCNRSLKIDPAAKIDQGALRAAWFVLFSANSGFEPDDG